MFSFVFKLLLTYYLIIQNVNGYDIVQANIC